MAVTPVVIPTTNQTVEWTEGQTNGSFDPFEVISKDGFKMKLEVRVVFRVRPEDAAFMVAKIGGIDNLKNNVMHPTIDSIFRNQASESSAMAYLQNRHDEQVKAEAKVRAHLVKYHVDLVNVLICHIHLPDELMKPQTERILAEQNKNMYTAQKDAEQERINLANITARAANLFNFRGVTVMRYGKEGKIVVVIQLASILLFALAGAFLGGANHNMLGACVGGFFGWLLPQMTGYLLLVANGQGSPLIRLLATLADNACVADSDDRELVETLRGFSLLVWFGLAVSVLLIGFGLESPLWARLVGGGSWGLLFGLLYLR